MRVQAFFVFDDQTCPLGSIAYSQWRKTSPYTALTAKYAKNACEICVFKKKVVPLCPI